MLMSRRSSIGMMGAPSSWNTCVVPGQPAKARTCTRMMTSERLTNVYSQGQQMDAKHFRRESVSMRAGPTLRHWQRHCGA